MEYIYAAKAKKRVRELCKRFVFFCKTFGKSRYRRDADLAFTRACIRPSRPEGETRRRWKKKKREQNDECNASQQKLIVALKPVTSRFCMYQFPYGLAVDYA
jgi:hypothetical protein